MPGNKISSGSHSPFLHFSLKFFKGFQDTVRTINPINVTKVPFPQYKITFAYYMLFNDFKQRILGHFHHLLSITPCCFAPNVTSASSISESNSPRLAPNLLRGEHVEKLKKQKTSKNQNAEAQRFQSVDQQPIAPETWEQLWHHSSALFPGRWEVTAIRLQQSPDAVSGHTEASRSQRRPVKRTRSPKA